MPTSIPFQGFFAATFALAATLSFAGESDSSKTTKVDTQVTLIVRDGRALTGHIDDRTDDEVVWIRLGRGDVVLSTGLSWDLIQEVQFENQRRTAAEFRELAKSYASASPKLSAINDDASNTLHPTILVSPPVNRSSLGRVLSVQAFADIANWDRDAESDGVALRVLPLGIDGRVLAIDGVISVELIGREFVNGRDNQEGFPTLGQWSQRVRSTDFRGYEGAVYRLPLTRRLDHDQTVLSIGMVHVQLNVTGQGHFEADAPIRLKSYNPIRDQLDQHHSRYDTFGRYRARHW